MQNILIVQESPSSPAPPVEQIIVEVINQQTLCAPPAF